MIHLRIVAPSEAAEAALRVLDDSPAINVVHVRGCALRPDGDLILADVPRESASVVLEQLRRAGLADTGSVAIESVPTQLSHAAEQAAEEAPGEPGDAVVWEELEAVTSESTALTITFLCFMALATLIAAVGIFLDSAILIVGAMVVGPEFGPLAGLCVALVQRRGRLAARSLAALGAGFPLAIAVALAASAIFRATGLTPDTFTEADHSLSASIANPDWFVAIVALAAGAAGMLSLTSAKSAALIGVLVSVTTIPSAANAGVAAAYAEWDTFGGSMGQLGLNLALLVVAGTVTLTLQHRVFARRLRDELS